MSNSVPNLTRPRNETVLSYARGTPERAEVEQQLSVMSRQTHEVPVIISGKNVETGQMGHCYVPHRHRQVLADYHRAGQGEVSAAVQAAMQAKPAWEAIPWEHRLSVFLKAADLLAGPWRQIINAATMLNQSKTVHQAEIDAACELADFIRYNAYFAAQIFSEQPVNEDAGVWNRAEYRPLEGFVFVVSPFNFTAIAGNLTSSAAMLGNTVVWKPASTALYSGYLLMRLFEQAGLPPGVINFVPGQGRLVGDMVLDSEDLGGVSFTGSTGAFNSIWQGVAARLSRYQSYPRLVGETGGKNYVFAHPSADVAPLVTALVRGAFEYQGQKCSAASRAYIPESLWGETCERLVQEIATIRCGAVEDFECFMGAVIDRASYDNISRYIDAARSSSSSRILAGGKCDCSEGYFIEPTLIVAEDPRFVTMQEELFGPVLTIHKYPDRRLAEAMELCATTSPYGLTGAFFAQDRAAIVEAERFFRHTTGMFYINDKPTGAVVGQQPFGGARASGTNDKAGGKHSLLRWISQRTIKESFYPPTDYRYPYMM